MNPIHGHEVIQMIHGLEKALSREDLIQEINKVFGKDAKFFNCPSQDMTADDIVLFFEAKGKLNFDSGTMRLEFGGTC